MRSHSEILKDISQFEPGNADNWLKLDALLSELWSVGQPPINTLAVLFGVFERFPEDDGAGVFWSIVHGVEALPYDYEPVLKESFSRVPSEMSKVMLARLANSRGAA